MYTRSKFTRLNDFLSWCNDVGISDWAILYPMAFSAVPASGMQSSDWMGEMMPTPDITRLPKWAQEYIEDLRREREMAIRALNSYIDEQTANRRGHQ